MVKLLVFVKYCFFHLIKARVSRVHKTRTQDRPRAFIIRACILRNVPRDLVTQGDPIFSYRNSPEEPNRCKIQSVATLEYENISH